MTNASQLWTKIRRGLESFPGLVIVPVICSTTLMKYLCDHICLHKELHLPYIFLGHMVKLGFCLLMPQTSSDTTRFVLDHNIEMFVSERISWSLLWSYFYFGMVVVAVERCQGEETLMSDKIVRPFSNISRTTRHILAQRKIYTWISQVVKAPPKEGS